MAWKKEIAHSQGGVPTYEYSWRYLRTTLKHLDSTRVTISETSR